MRVEPLEMGLVHYRRDPTEVPGPLHHVRTQSEVCSWEEGPTQMCWPLDLGRPSLQNCEK